MIHKAIRTLYPSVTEIIEEVDGTVTILDANGDVVAVNQSQVDAEVATLNAAYDAQAYARSRALEYPTIPDQLDDIYHNGIDAWKATIKVTKDKYPK